MHSIIYSILNFILYNSAIFVIDHILFWGLFMWFIFFFHQPKLRRGWMLPPPSTLTNTFWGAVYVVYIFFFTPTQTTTLGDIPSYPHKPFPQTLSVERERRGGGGVRGGKATASNNSMWLCDHNYVNSLVNFTKVIIFDAWSCEEAMRLRAVGGGAS